MGKAERRWGDLRRGLGSELPCLLLKSLAPGAVGASGGGWFAERADILCDAMDRRGPSARPLGLVPHPCLELPWVGGISKDPLAAPPQVAGCLARCRCGLLSP